MQILPLPPPVRGLPLVGNALQFLRDPIGLIQRGAREHGRMFSIKLGPRTAVIALGPEHNRFVYEQTDKLLSIQEAYPFMAEMFGENMYFLAEHAEYKRQKAIVAPCFTGKKMGAYVDIMRREAEEFMDAKLGDEGVLEATTTLGPLVMNIAAHCLVGEKFRRTLGDEFFGVYRDFSAGIDFLLPMWLPLPSFRKSARAKKHLHAMFSRTIDERRVRPLDPPDFLQSLVDARRDDGRPALDDDLLVNLITGLVFAGHETTVGQLAWTLLLLLEHPEYLATVREELEPVAREGALDFERLKRLERIEWAVKESERMQPVATFNPRMVKQAADVGGYHLPAGTMLFVSAAVSHRLPEVFAEPDRYDPERFGPGREEDRRPYSLIGFGGATHKCLGMNFAYLEMKLVLAMLLDRYQVELVDHDVPPMKGMTSKWPASPCRVRYRLRAGARRPARVYDRPVATVEEAPAGLQRQAVCPFHALLGKKAHA